jgi:hypothetical protein
MADIAVVGAGPSGMMAAIAAAGRSARVLVCEQLSRAGVRLLATGGGRCNLTNTLAVDQFMARFGRQGRFMLPALKQMDSRALVRFFAALGVQTCAADGLHVYPRSGQAATVRQALLRRCRQLNVEIRAGASVSRLRIEGDRLAGLETSSGRVEAPRVIIATGGRSYPELGGTGAGYELARQVGHGIVEPSPALVPLVMAENWPRKLAGVSVQGAAVRIDLPGQPRKPVHGSILFTHRGLSGPAVLDLSGEVPALLKRHGSVPLLLNFVLPPAAADWRSSFARWKVTDGKKMVRTLLAERIPAALAAILCELAGLASGSRMSDLPADRRDELIRLLTGCPLTVTGVEGWHHAMVTRGGVALRDVDPETLESRLLGGLHFCGEVLDLDGPCGGFNLQWAFASGYLAGMAACRSLRAGNASSPSGRPGPNPAQYPGK